MGVFEKKKKACRKGEEGGWGRLKLVKIRNIDDLKFKILRFKTVRKQVKVLMCEVELTDGVLFYVFLDSHLIS